MRYLPKISCKYLSCYHSRRSSSEWLQRLCLLNATAPCLLHTDTLSESFIRSLTPCNCLANIPPPADNHRPVSQLSPAALSSSSLQMCWLYPLRLGRRKREQWARGASRERETRPSQRPQWGILKAGLCSLNPRPDRRGTEGQSTKQKRWNLMEKCSFNFPMTGTNTVTVTELLFHLLFDSVLSNIGESQVLI